MKTILNQLLPDDFRLQTKTPFNVLIAYDEVSMGIRAKHIADSAARTLGQDHSLVLKVWKLAMFQMPELADTAADDAADADMIILALREDNGVPHETKAWIETWLARRNGAEGALVLLFDPARKPTTAVMHTDFYLTDVGRRGNLDVFIQTGSDDSDHMGSSCKQCDRFHVATPQPLSLAGSLSGRMGKNGQTWDPIRIAYTTPGATRSIQVA